ncbi:hypothetical protein HanRHA438_Chr14g0644801 [Helianthus annuus]|uniref:Uncharacterized protein n=1 Tax=Helianthus annuus TaxID=4232 RepID=A0A251SF57_HELAN|nr:hypothetical protein HanXRQr2_Chr14g0633921 [Helianthus annuus]KAJ0839530.1 hypothetical protein HanPSC8_Chr14g0607951 [Helianthus annuus]KAJ0852883.1 hypothetical protein HanRHA438_Chr14g0644801 [Helianthus annuus]
MIRHRRSQRRQWRRWRWVEAPPMRFTVGSIGYGRCLYQFTCYRGGSLCPTVNHWKNLFFFFLIVF